MQTTSQRYRPTDLLLRNLMGCARVNHDSRHSHETASSVKRSEPTAGCRVDRLVGMEIMPLLGSRHLARKRDYSLVRLGRISLVNFSGDQWVSFEDLRVKAFWSLLGAFSRRGMEPHGLHDRP